MDELTKYCSWADTQLQDDPVAQKTIPADLRRQLLEANNDDYLDVLADLTLVPEYSNLILVLYQPLISEIFARKYLHLETGRDLGSHVRLLSCMARVVPFATYIQPAIKRILGSGLLRPVLSGASPIEEDLSPNDLHSLLLALFRLLSFDDLAYGCLAQPLFFSSLLHHRNPSIRYLAVECLCLTMRFADKLTTKLIHRHVGADAVLGPWEGTQIDFRLLKLYEENRWKDIERSMKIRSEAYAAIEPHTSRVGKTFDLSPNVASLGGVLIPRHQVQELQPGSYVVTPTSLSNLRQFGLALHEAKPLIVCGPPSSGKTALIMGAARLLGKAADLVTLHLNEQTDAKSLLGLYSSSADGTSFIWQPGVLTKALQQGRWVVIEDIDRAPAEVLGLLRPLIENGVLFLPNRRETIRSEDGFRLFATLRTSSRSGTARQSRHEWITSDRLWSIVEVQTMEDAELEGLIHQKFPRLRTLVSALMTAHRNINRLFTDTSNFKGTQTRLPSVRELLKWCRRTETRLKEYELLQFGHKIPDYAQLELLKNGIDCYGAYLSEESLREEVALAIAKELNISPSQVKHAMYSEDMKIVEKSSNVQVGRCSLIKNSSRSGRAASGPFAMTTTAQRALELIAAAVSFSEPLLLVGETGVGKTTLVQHVAGLTGQKLTVVNLSQQSEAADLLGGLKPITTRTIMLPLVEAFMSLFDATFSAKRNERFQAATTKAVAKQNWSRLLILWQEALNLAETALKQSESNGVEEAIRPNKKRKLTDTKRQQLAQRWRDFARLLHETKPRIEGGTRNQIFTFVEGSLVQAVRNGEWLLLDEINLASAETLDHLVSLLHDGADEKPSLLLVEAGKIERIIAHPNFRIFAAMNPATDTGKKDLGVAIRSHFTELYVGSGDDRADDLVKIIQVYLGTILSNDRRAALDLANAYLEIKKLNNERKLTDGAGDAPHFSIRSLTRCLLYVSQHSASHGLRRAMVEGFAMSFFTSLDRASESLAIPVLNKHLLSNVKNIKSFLAQQLPATMNEAGYVKFQHHLVRRGPLDPDPQPHYIRTPSVERNLINLARAASMRRFPILLQGPTSAGKTSMVEFLAKLSGNKFVRINNHEHTDLQEYLGSYSSGPDGRLEYVEGVLVDALRKGHWIVLDELNLAPSDVLEALNRLLDDNRELFVPESQEVVRPHPNFMLFATQNPAGLYGGRKRLSRAFRNRFLELHFDDIPEEELEIILRERSLLPPSFCSNIVTVYKKLSLQRQSARLFEQRNSFATLRDLFRWASRPAEDRQHLAQNGFMLLGERVRDAGERKIVKTTIEETMKVVLDETTLYGEPAVPKKALDDPTVIWTPSMRRLFVLISCALNNNEPVLLVGETGCGKTQVCQVVAQVFDKQLNVYNAHTNTETGDLIGSQRPVRHRSELAMDVTNSIIALLSNGEAKGYWTDMDTEELIEHFETLDKTKYDIEKVTQAKSSISAYRSLFSWVDGSLVRAMRAGEHFLLDEISLADDSVLERLNSVLEPSRTILLAEKGTNDSYVVAHPSFQFLATMNPGGDYGKRELSAALRNRLTEIWVPPLSEEADVLPILRAKLSSSIQPFALYMLEFSTWFKNVFSQSASTAVSLRDLLTWVEFCNRSQDLPRWTAFIQGAAMVYIDSIGANPAGLAGSIASNVETARAQAVDHLQSTLEKDVWSIYDQTPAFHVQKDQLTVGFFSLPNKGKSEIDNLEVVFHAPTTLKNSMRIVRALQMARPILLEGSPGVGKTAIVTALADLVGKSLSRINLSDQTDLMDLFGADVPSEGEKLGQFTWRDGPLLQAMQSGGWVLLDEMNLASQSVLEGLNSCLDHRQQVYIAELDKSFTCHPDFVLFAAQNPHHQGGGRKGLPASFVNRFTVVYADQFQYEDLECICRVKYPMIDQEQLSKMIQLVSTIDESLHTKPAFSQGGPWELNLRDINRWLALCQHFPRLDLLDHFGTIIGRRFRGAIQQSAVQSICNELAVTCPAESFYSGMTANAYQVGTSLLERNESLHFSIGSPADIYIKHLPAVKSITTAINEQWPIILCGSSGSGKTSLIRSLAAVSGAELVEFSLSADVDAMDLVGGFEQYDSKRELSRLQHEMQKHLVDRAILLLDGGAPSSHVQPVLLGLQNISQSAVTTRDLRAVVQLLNSDSQAKDQYTEYLDRLEVIDQGRGSSFVWNDGILTDAVQRGCWLVLDNANLCNPSILDRLNSLLEPNGKLIMSEQHSGGETVRSIKPHPNFRIFMTVDPRYGELSRAMRNRSLEIYIERDASEITQSKAIHYPYCSHLYRIRALMEVDSSSANAAENGACSVVEPFIQNLTSLDDELATNLARNSARSDVQNLLQTTIYARSLPKSEEQVAISQQFNPGMVGVQSLSLQKPNMLALNEPYLQLSRTPQDNLLAAQFELVVFQLSRLLRSLDVEVQKAANLPVSSMTVFQQSIIRSENKRRIERVPPIHAFLEAVSNTIVGLIQSNSKVPMSLMELGAAKKVLDYCQDLLLLCSNTSIDASLFNAYKQVATDVVHYCSSKQAIGIQNMFSNLIGKLVTSQSLTTGHSLQLMWESWRPRTATTMEQFNDQLALEAVIDRFDAILVRPIPGKGRLLNTRQNLMNVYRSILINDYSSGNIRSLEKALLVLEEQQQQRSVAVGHFGQVFDKIHQCLSFRLQDKPESELGHIAIYARTPSMLRTLVSSDGAIPKVLSQVALYGGVVAERSSVLAYQIIDQLMSVGNQALDTLDYTYEELMILTTSLCIHSPDLSNPTLEPLIHGVQTLVQGVLQAHRSFLLAFGLPDNVSGHFDLHQLAQAGLKLSESSIDDSSKYFARVYKDYLLPVMSNLTQDHNATPDTIGNVLVLISTAALILMVPDQIYDPAIYPALVGDLHSRHQNEVQSALKSYRNFHQLTSGQETSLVIRALEREYTELGDAPRVPRVIRPEISGLDEVHAEFRNILRNVVEAIPGPSASTHKVQLQSLQIRHLQASIGTIVQRLKNLHRAYDDIVMPISWLLQCLEVGLRLYQRSRPTNGSSSSSSLISSHIPLLGIDPQAIMRWPKPEFFSSHQYKLQWLEHQAYQNALLVRENSSPEPSVSILGFIDVIDAFYLEWKAKLGQDQIEEERKSRYYHYRGGDDDDDNSVMDQVAQMFPTFDQEEGLSFQEHTEEENMLEGTSESSGSYRARETAVQLATVHEKLHDPSSSKQNAAEYIIRVLQTSSIQSSAHQQSSDVDRSNLFGILPLLLEDKLNSLQNDDSKRVLDIYTEGSISESKSLVGLVRMIQSRFEEIQTAWPEHAVPGEVLAFCSEILQLKLSDPIAKLMPKVEKMVEIVSQWQSVASKQWSVQELIDRLTAMIIKWRRMELGSWSKLLETEKRKQEDDAKSWYFIAYEAVIHNSRIVIQDEAHDIGDYCRELAKTLSEFIRITNLGQFSGRLRLLSTLENTLASLSLTIPQLHPVYRTMTSVLQFYRRYEQHIRQTLQKGQSELEKSLQEQIKLASWKDTNITALRESARRSHHNLFKIVRKFRSLLSQPLPELTAVEAHKDYTVSNEDLDLKPISVDNDTTIKSALTECEVALPDWKLRSARLTDPLEARQMMRMLYQRSKPAFSSYQEISSWRNTLIDEVKELRSQTPSSMNDDTKSVIKHLREQKRRLFADTMKSLMHMGVRRNLSTVELQAQDSVYAILARYPDLSLMKTGVKEETSQTSTQLTAASNSAFCELLEQMEQARASTRGHSDSLTQGEVIRGAGLLEGILWLVTNQRHSLESYILATRKFESSWTVVSAISTEPRESIASKSKFDPRKRSYEQLLSWLPELLDLTIHILRFQSGHGNFTLGIESVLETTSGGWRNLKRTLQDTKPLPEGIVSTHEERHRAVLQDQLEGLRRTIQDEIEREPKTAAVLKSLLPWTDVLNNDNQEQAQDAKSTWSRQVSEVDSLVQRALDGIFVALKNAVGALGQDKTPTSTDDQNWLVKSTTQLQRSAHALRASEISQLLSQVLNMLQHLSEEDLGLACSIFVVASPILNIYRIICSDIRDRLLAEHLETIRLASFLAKTFTTLCREGYCEPADTSGKQDEQSGKLESGTGLGEGEGAEDISKDVGEDEDLSELAQNAEKEDKDGKDEMEASKDAVDMDHDDLQGETGDEMEREDEDKASDGDSGEEDDGLDEEVGSVDGFEPSAVDEKIWDDMRDELKNEKELESQKEKGKKGDDMTAKGENERQNEAGDGDEGEMEEQDDGADESDSDAEEGNGVPEAAPELTDPYAEEEGKLDLPEELQLNGEEELGDVDMSDDEAMNGLSDIDEGEDRGVEDQLQEPGSANDTDDDTPSQAEEDGNAGPDQADEDQNGGEDDELANEDKLNTQQDQDSMQYDLDDELDASGGDAGVANRAQDTVDENQTKQGKNKFQDSTQATNQLPQDQSNADDQEGGDQGRGTVERGIGRNQTAEQRQDEALKRLADALESFHQRREIFAASEDKQQEINGVEDIDMKDAEFEHVGDENEAETQALGATSAEQTQNLNQSRAIEDENIDVDNENIPADVAEQDKEIEESIAERFSRLQAQGRVDQDVVGNSFIPNQGSARQDREQKDLADEMDEDTRSNDEHVNVPPEQVAQRSENMSIADATRLWNQCTASTQRFSLLLTEQLRLILSPTTATKLRGDYRTGKRLNLKRIIPYIASGYKRDKIWMRRSVPSKRNYQIMLAVDDSKSMSESGADLLAFETVTMLARSLSMLEAGEISIVGFGDEEQIRIAHPFGRPFTSDSGIEVFRQFGFRQKGTNVKNLMRQSLDLFRDARLRTSSYGSQSNELWQLQLIISDGHCSDHDAIRRLVRQAHSEKIMVVFVIVDSMSSSSATIMNQAQASESILDLQEAYFEPDPDPEKAARGEMKVVTRRYLEGFPFQYYLVVRDVQELPLILATALKGWFRSVVEV